MTKEKTFLKINYKGKWFCIQDKIMEGMFDAPIGKITKEEALKPDVVKEHKENCDYFGIPAYIGQDKDMLKIYG